MDRKQRTIQATAPYSYEKQFLKRNHVLKSLASIILENPTSYDGSKLNLVGFNIDYIDVLPSNAFALKCKTLYLSNNNMKDLDNIVQFKNVTILSLSNNIIKYLDLLDPLVHLSNLEKISLDGNIVATMPYYRQYLIGLCPQIKVIDGIRVTSSEKSEALTLNAKVKISRERLRLNEFRYTVMSHLLNLTRCHVIMTDNVIGKFRSLRGPHVASAGEFASINSSGQSILKHCMNGGVYSHLQQNYSKYFDRKTCGLLRRAYMELNRRLNTNQRLAIANANSVVLWDDAITECTNYQETTIASMIDSFDIEIRRLRIPVASADKCSTSEALNSINFTVVLSIESAFDVRNLKTNISVESLPPKQIDPDDSLERTSTVKNIIPHWDTNIITSFITKQIDIDSFQSIDWDTLNVDNNQLGSKEYPQSPVFTDIDSQNMKSLKSQVSQLFHELSLKQRDEMDCRLANEVYTKEAARANKIVINNIELALTKLKEGSELKYRLGEDNFSGKKLLEEYKQVIGVIDQLKQNIANISNVIDASKRKRNDLLNLIKHEVTVKGNMKSSENEVLATMNDISNQFNIDEEIRSVIRRQHLVNIATDYWKISNSFKRKVFNLLRKRIYEIQKIQLFMKRRSKIRLMKLYRNCWKKLKRVTHNKLTLKSTCLKYVTKKFLKRWMKHVFKLKILRKRRSTPRFILMFKRFKTYKRRKYFYLWIAYHKAKVCKSLSQTYDQGLVTNNYTRKIFNSIVRFSEMQKQLHSITVAERQRAHLIYKRKIFKSWKLQHIAMKNVILSKAANVRRKLRGIQIIRSFKIWYIAFRAHMHYNNYNCCKYFSKWNAICLIRKNNNKILKNAFIKRKPLLLRPALYKLIAYSRRKISLRSAYRRVAYRKYMTISSTAWFSWMHLFTYIRKKFNKDTLAFSHYVARLIFRTFLSWKSLCAVEKSKAPQMCNLHIVGAEPVHLPFEQHQVPLTVEKVNHTKRQLTVLDTIDSDSDSESNKYCKSIYHLRSLFHKWITFASTKKHLQKNALLVAQKQRINNLRKNFLYLCSIRIKHAIGRITFLERDTYNVDNASELSRVIGDEKKQLVEFQEQMESIIAIHEDLTANYEYLETKSVDLEYQRVRLTDNRLSIEDEVQEIRSKCQRLLKLYEDGKYINQDISPFYDIPSEISDSKQQLLKEVEESYDRAVQLQNSFHHQHSILSSSAKSAANFTTCCEQDISLLEERINVLLNHRKVLESAFQDCSSKLEVSVDSLRKHSEYNDSTIAALKYQKEENTKRYNILLEEEKDLRQELESLNAAMFTVSTTAQASNDSIGIETIDYFCRSNIIRENLQIENQRSILLEDLKDEFVSSNKENKSNYHKAYIIDEDAKQYDALNNKIKHRLTNL